MATGGRLGPPDPLPFAQMEATEPQDVVAYDQSTRDASVLAADSFLSILLSKLDGCFDSVAILTGAFLRPLSPWLVAGRGQGGGAVHVGPHSDRPLLSSLSPEPSVCWGSGGPVGRSSGALEFLRDSTDPPPAPTLQVPSPARPRPTTSR